MDKKSLAIISGKGGSGKTTLSILLSQFLVDCGKKVLLVDCDLCTHGATYFLFNGQCREQRDSLVTVEKILQGDVNNNILSINDDFNFIPSSLTFNSLEGDTQQEVNYSHFNDFIKLNTNSYNVIIYDCQAGYCKLTDLVVKQLSDKKLAPLENDYISDLSFGVLLKKLGMSESDISILYNKLTEDKFDCELQEVIDETKKFSNIPYEDEIRKAFQKGVLPEIGKNMPEITKIIGNLAEEVFNKDNEISEGQKNSHSESNEKTKTFFHYDMSEIEKSIEKKKH
jgi:cellulose biosynthesis protein BcsQ